MYPAAPGRGRAFGAAWDSPRIGSSISFGVTISTGIRTTFVMVYRGPAHVALPGTSRLIKKASAHKLERASQLPARPSVTYLGRTLLPVLYEVLCTVVEWLKGAPRTEESIAMDPVHSCPWWCCGFVGFWWSGGKKKQEKKGRRKEIGPCEGAVRVPSEDLEDK